jgi:biofilm PGA synthesis N-glycosyltransferase PgaC
MVLPDLVSSVYWNLNWLVTVIAFPRALFFSRPGRRGRWLTTDRGVP